MRLLVSARRRALVLAGLTLGAAAASISACGDEATLSITIAPTHLTVAKGATATFSVNIERGGSFSGDVTLAATTLPAEITVAYDPVSVSSSIHASTGNVVVAEDAVSGVYPITIVAVGNGVPNATTTLTVTVP